MFGGHVLVRSLPNNVSVVLTDEKRSFVRGVPLILKEPQTFGPRTIPGLKPGAKAGM